MAPRSSRIVRTSPYSPELKDCEGRGRGTVEVLVAAGRRRAGLHELPARQLEITDPSWTVHRPGTGLHTHHGSKCFARPSWRNQALAGVGPAGVGSPPFHLSLSPRPQFSPLSPARAGGGGPPVPGGRNCAAFSSPVCGGPSSLWARPRSLPSAPPRTGRASPSRDPPPRRRAASAETPEPKRRERREPALDLAPGLEPRVASMALLSASAADPKRDARRG